jgi:hypothetical protein
LLAAQRKFGAGNVLYARGCNICDDVPPGFPNMPCEPGHATDSSGIPAAVDAASAASAAVVFVGLDQTSEAENFDRNNLTLPGVQKELVQSVLAAQPNTVVVLVNGGPVSSEWIASNVPAVVEAFYPGELGGDAIVDVLVGDYNPGGKMPYTVYPENFTDSRDIRDMDLSSNDGVTVGWHTGDVIYPFGWGLSYTTFTYEWADGGNNENGVMTLVDGGAIDDRATVSTHSVRVANTGNRSGDCVVLAFVVSPSSTAARDSGEGSAPLKHLFGFKRVPLGPGEAQTVTFELIANDVALTQPDGRRVYRDREFTISIGDVLRPATKRSRLVVKE